MAIGDPKAKEDRSVRKTVWEAGVNDPEIL